jgi:hypothetical protein
MPGKRLVLERVPREVVEGDDLVVVDQAPDQRGSNETRSTCDEDSLSLDHGARRWTAT